MMWINPVNEAFPGWVRPYPPPGAEQTEIYDVSSSGKGKGMYVAKAALAKKVEFPDPSDRLPTILVVEDEFLVRLALSDYLQECGFKVLEAGNADEAIAALKINKFGIDLVFSDVQMPGPMDGFCLAQWVRANLPGLPVLLTSGDGKKAETAKALCENEPFLAKPYDLDAVVAQIRAAISSSKPE
jgi:CheY-like chemotaxis protein